jgi:hypothetical protein
VFLRNRETDGERARMGARKKVTEKKMKGNSEKA